MPLATVPEGFQVVAGIALMLLAIPFTWQMIQRLRTGTTHFPLSVMFPGRAERGQKRYFLVMLANFLAATLLWIAGLANLTRGLG